ncbi:MAG TPA: OsmC family peroxiredoxin [Vicinamibacterales bacterium]|nr:OsmC family peroxiredoxin [Vicinamibacterales bacterium]
MPSFSRSVTVNWSGPLREGGKGEVKSGTGAFTLPVNFPSRVGDAAGVTSPEELIAAAHGSCYAMALNATVGRKGGSIGKTHITCTISADLGEAGIKIVSSKLTVVAEGLTGIDPATFPDVAKEAEGKCPVSNALRGSLAIEVNASVK